MIEMSARVQTAQQWVGIGFSKDILMVLKFEDYNILIVLPRQSVQPNSDAVLAWMDSTGTTPVFSDRYLSGRFANQQGADSNQDDISNTEGSYNNGIATYKFTKKSDSTVYTDAFVLMIQLKPFLPTATLDYYSGNPRY